MHAHLAKVVPAGLPSNVKIVAKRPAAEVDELLPKDLAKVPVPRQWLRKRKWSRAIEHSEACIEYTISL